MRLLRTFATILLPVTLVVSCGDDESGTEPSSDAASSAASSSAATSSAADPVVSSAPAWTGEEIPDGTYAKTVTKADARAAGIRDKAWLEEELGIEDSATYAFKFLGHRWAAFLIPDGEAPDPGDVGTLKYDQKGDVSMLSESEGCPGCVYTYDWKLTDDVLTLRIVGHESTDGPEDLAKVRFVTEGDFTRQS